MPPPKLLPKPMMNVQHFCFIKISGKQPRHINLCLVTAIAEFNDEIVLNFTDGSNLCLNGRDKERVLEAIAPPN